MPLPAIHILDEGSLGDACSVSRRMGRTLRVWCCAFCPASSHPRPSRELTSTRALFDWRQLRRWGISEQSLPADAEIDFRDLSVWRTYSWQIAAILAVIVVQAGLISLLLYEKGRRRYAEVQSRERMSEPAHVNRFSTAGELTASIAHEINMLKKAPFEPADIDLNDLVRETEQFLSAQPAYHLAGASLVTQDIFSDLLHLQQLHHSKALATCRPAASRSF